MRATRSLGRLLAIGTAVAMLAACTGKQAQGDTFKVGIDLPISGGDASNGIPTQNGATLAIEEANAKGLPGGLKVAAYPLDDATQGTHDPAAGAQNIKTFIADGAVMGVIGPFNSNVAQAEIPLTNDAGLVQISPSNTNDGLTIGDTAKKLRTSKPDQNAYFRVCTRDANQGSAAAQFAAKLGFKKAYIIDDNETYGKGLADVFEASFKSSGTVLGHEHITKNQQDFKALLTKIKGTGPDVVFYGGTTVTGGGLLRKQMGDTGLKAVAYMGGDGISDAEFMKTAGTMASGSYYTVAAPETSKLDSAKAFVDAYKKKYNAAPGPYSANAYTGAMIIIDAVSKAAAANGNKMPTRADVLKNVAALKDFNSPIGTLGFDANGDTTNGVLSLYQIKNNKIVFVNQINLKS